VGNVGDAAFSTGDVMRRLRELESTVRELSAGRRLENASIGAGGIRVKSQGVIRSDTFDGNLSTNTPGDHGWALGADRLVIRGQFVGPFDFEGRGGQADDFTVNTTRVDRATASIPVPSWADEALVLCSVTGQAINPGTNPQDYLGLKPVVNGVTLGRDAFFVAMPGNIACGSVTFSITIPVDDVSTIECAAQLWANGNDWGSNTFNMAQTNGTAIFRRFD